METEAPKMLERTCAKTHPGLKIDKMECLTKNSKTQTYASLILWVKNGEMANHLIQLGRALESDIKTVEYYDMKCRIKQCLKCQEYGHLTYGCRNDQRCAHCAKARRTESCPHAQEKISWRCGACKGKHRAFDPECPKRQAEKERIRAATGTRPMHHPIRAATTPPIVRLGPPTAFKGDDGSTGFPVEATTKRRKVGRPSMASKFQTTPVVPGESVAQRLTKRNRSDESTGSQSMLVS